MNRRFIQVNSTDYDNAENTLVMIIMLMNL